MSEDSRCKSSTLLGTSRRIEQCLKDAGHDVDTTPESEDSIHVSEHANWTNDDPDTQDIDDDFEDDDDDEDIVDEEFDRDFIIEDQEDDDEELLTHPKK